VNQEINNLLINNEDANEQTLHAIEGQEMFGYSSHKKLNFLANGHACVDFGCTHPIDGLFESLPIYLLGKKQFI